VLDPLNGYIAAVLGRVTEKDSDFNFGPKEPSLTVREVVTQATNFWPDLKVVFENSTQNNHMIESSFLEIDSSKAENQLNWKPRWNQTEAIRKTIEWWDDVSKRNLTPIEACKRDLDHFLE
jgi:CDP-glucose 4,6-dehydratase